MEGIRQVTFDRKCLSHTTRFLFQDFSWESHAANLVFEESHETNLIFEGVPHANLVFDAMAA